MAKLQPLKRRTNSLCPETLSQKWLGNWKAWIKSKNNAQNCHLRRLYYQPWRP